MIELTDVNIAKAWREGIRADACARFSTVLGPGSDGHHEEHIHVDLAERRGSGTGSDNGADAGEEAAASAGGSFFSASVAGSRTSHWHIL